MLPDRVLEVLRRIQAGGVYPVAWLATVGSDGSGRVRAIVLRGLDEAAGTCRFYADSRHQKWQEIQRQPEVEICIVNLAEGPLQLRFRCHLRAVVASDERRRCWNALRPESRRQIYQAAPDAIEPPDYFLVLEGRVGEIDLLDLGTDPSLRLGFIPGEAGYREEVRSA